MADKFLNQSGLSRFWEKIKDLLDGKVSKSGDTITGALNFRTGSSVPIMWFEAPEKSGVGRARMRLFKNASATVDYGTHIMDYVWGDGSNNDKRVCLAIRAFATLPANQIALLSYPAGGGSATTYYFFGTHNPPAVADVTGLQAALDKKADEEDIDQLYSATTYGPDEVVTFDGKIEGMPLQFCLAEINAVQEGSGDPSPSNIRAISGWTGANVSIADIAGPVQISASQAGSGDPSPENVRPIVPGLTLTRDDGSTLEVYGGTVDVVSGVLTVTHVCHTLTGTEDWALNSANNYRKFFQLLSNLGWEEWNPEFVDQLASSHFARVPVSNQETAQFGAYRMSATEYLILIDNGSEMENKDALNAWIQAQTDPVRFCYPLATPVTYQLTPQEVARALTSLGYAAEHYSVSWQTEPGTVYGGTVDLVSGTLTVTHGCVTFDGTEAWNTQGTNMIFWRTLDSLGPAAKEGSGGVFSHLPYGYITGNNTNTGARVGVNNGSSRIYLRYDGMPSTVADWKAELSQWYADGTPFQAVYEMANPVTYQLTPQAITALAGENHIRADTGDVTVEYGGFLRTMWEEIGKLREETAGNGE